MSLVYGTDILVLAVSQTPLVGSHGCCGGGGVGAAAGFLVLIHR